MLQMVNPENPVVLCNDYPVGDEVYPTGGLRCASSGDYISEDTHMVIYDLVAGIYVKD